MTHAHVPKICAKTHSCVTLLFFFHTFICDRYETVTPNKIDINKKGIEVDAPARKMAVCPNPYPTFSFILLVCHVSHQDSFTATVTN